MKKIREMLQIELAAFVQSHLRSLGVDVVLSGEAAISFYTDNQYESLDVDLINLNFVRPKKIEEGMAEIEFVVKGRYFSHPETSFFVEFPAGPLAVGQEPVEQIDEHPLATGILRIISPTDCVKDRLLGYFHWDDQQSLEQAVLVAKSISVDMDELDRWVKGEGMANKFLEIKSRLGS